MRQVLRNERKFLINTVEFMKFKHYLSHLLHQDLHNQAQGYLIRSLYFDTEYDTDFFDKAHGFEVRRKMRLRIYDPNGDFAMLEMKQKQGNQQRKRSLRINKTDAIQLTKGNYRVLLNYNEPFAAECYALMTTRSYRPRCIVDYQRFAFVAKENDIRITFDHHIKATQSNFDIFNNHLLMVPVLDDSQVVLEVKYNNFLLSYIKDMLVGIDKSELSVSKYSLARQISYFEHI